MLWHMTTDFVLHDQSLDGSATLNAFAKQQVIGHDMKHLSMPLLHLVWQLD